MYGENEQKPLKDYSNAEFSPEPRSSQRPAKKKKREFDEISFLRQNRSDDAIWYEGE